MDDFLKSHVDYLSSDLVPFIDKVNYYKEYANNLYDFENTNEADKQWSVVSAALAYTELTNEERQIIFNLYKSRTRGVYRGAAVLKRFEVEQNVSVETLQTFLNTFTYEEIQAARNLAHNFITETQGSRLFERIYMIAEATYLERKDDVGEVQASNLAYNTFVRLIQTPLIPAKEQNRYIAYAREVYLNDKG